MSLLHDRHNVLHGAVRAMKALPSPQPVHLEHLLATPALQVVDLSKRSPSSSTASPATTCAAKDNSAQCQKPTSSSTLAIVLAAVIPISVALIAFVYLHRRHLIKLRKEDANDRHKSLDFGMDPSNAAAMSGKHKNSGGKAFVASELETEKAFRRERGMSMDMDTPYLLPPELHSSRESLHSLSRTINNRDDRYRPATTFIPNDTSMPMYSTPKRGNDDSSSYTGSSGQGFRPDGMNQNLLRNAQRMSRSLPPTQRDSIGSGRSGSQVRVAEPPLGLPRNGLPSNPSPKNAGLTPGHQLDTRDSYTGKDGADLRLSNNYLGAFIHSREPSVDTHNQAQVSKSESKPPASLPTTQVSSDRFSPPPVINVAAASPPPRKQSLQNKSQPIYHEGLLDDNIGSRVKTSGSHLVDDQRRSRNFSMSAVDEYLPSGFEVPSFDLDSRRLSTGIRPLPREDPRDNPEQRANRIRSFYKEYFDDSKPMPPLPAGDYIEDYGQEHYGEAPVFDPVSGQFVVAQALYAETITRRAMTPPPRAPPRFQSPSRQQNIAPNSQNMTRGPRAFSSASGRFGPPARGPPRKVLPPPSPLRTLPTPHLLKEDAFALPIDFAPPTNYRDRQAGRPESPRSQQRPFSPMLPAHVPLASSYDDLSVMPSPHLLRKSGTFTALDFAPPPRFKNSDAGSDAGSIRSGRSHGSAMSAAQLHNIRAGAYRVSRIPKEAVGTKDDLMDSLRPTWSLRPHDS